MKVSRQQAAEHRERIIEAAAKLFRERGFAGVGVAELMHDVGLTHGGFYGHFASKEDLVAQACQRAVSRSLDEWKRRADTAPSDPLAAVITPYLSAEHRDRPGTGCLLAALGPDLSRQAPPVRRVITEWLSAAIAALANLIPARSQAARRRKAIATFASMVGALIMARAVDDPALSEEILAAVSASITPGERLNRPADFPALAKAAVRSVLAAEHRGGSPPGHVPARGEEERQHDRQDDERQQPGGDRALGRR